MSLLEIGVSVLLAKVCFWAYVIFMVRAITRRRPGTGIFDAPPRFPPNLLFTPDRLLPEAATSRRWALGLLAAFLTFLVVAVLGVISNDSVAY